MDATAVLTALMTGDLARVMDSVNWDEREDFTIPELPGMMGLPPLPGMTVVLARIGPANARYYPGVGTYNGLDIHVHEDANEAAACYRHGTDMYRVQAAEIAADPSGAMRRLLTNAFAASDSDGE